MDNIIKLIIKGMINTYRIHFDENRLKEILKDLNEKHFEIEKEIAYSLMGRDAIISNFIEKNYKTKDLLYVVKDEYSFKSEYEQGVYGEKYLVVYKKYSLLYYLASNKNSNIIRYLYCYIFNKSLDPEIYTYYDETMHITHKHLKAIIASMDDCDDFIYDDYISKEEKENYINDILNCINLELIDSKEIKNYNDELDKISKDTSKYINLLNHKFVKNDNKVKKITAI